MDPAVENTAYVELLKLTAGHSGTINSLSFSSDGKYLASGGDDYAVIIWNASRGSQLYRFMFEGPVGCVLWHPVQPETVIVGCDSGHLFQIHHFSLKDYEKHQVNLGVRSNIISLDYNVASRYLAVGMGNEVHVTRERHSNQYQGAKKLPSPSNVDEDDVDQRLRPVAVHFNRDGTNLIVSYLHHGVICWDTEALTALWSISPPATTPEIGGSAMSPTGRNIILYNMSTGVDRYLVGSNAKPRQSYRFKKPASTKLALSTAFIHEGHAIVCGTTTGRVCIWHTKSGDLYQVLDHDEDVVQAISAACCRNFSYIAAGSANKGQGTYIKIWRARINQKLAPPDMPDSLANIVQAVTLNRVDPRGPIGHGIAVSLTIILCLGMTWAWMMLPWTYIASFTLENGRVLMVFLWNKLLVLAYKLGEWFGVVSDLGVRLFAYLADSLRSAALGFLFPTDRAAAPAL